MMNSRAVISTQTAPHQNLPQAIKAHLNHPWRQPVADHNRQAFEKLQHKLAQAPAAGLVLDAGCGTGDSTLQLAARHPEHWVMGVDKSAQRLQRQRQLSPPDNMILLRCDLVDFWRLAVAANWRCDHQYWLYQNPWPKPVHYKRRWAAHPILPWALALGGQLEARSNWQVYLQELATALQLTAQHQQLPNPNSQLRPLAYQNTPLTPFELKYQNSEQALWQLQTNLSIFDGITDHNGFTLSAFS